MSLRINSPHQTLTPNPDSHSSLERTSDFSGVLSKTQQIQKAGLQTFLERLETQRKTLTNSLSIRDLRDFRDMIKSYLRSTFGQSRQQRAKKLPPTN